MTAILSGLFLLAFVVISIMAFVQLTGSDPATCNASTSFSNAVGQKLTSDDSPGAADDSPGTARDYIATLIAALVAGVVAVAFGLPEGKSFWKVDARGWMITAYSIGFFLMGLAAIVLWTAKEPCTGPYVKNLGTTCLGMGLAIVGAYLKGSRNQ